MRIIRRSELREGRWRNGMGASWDIASEPPGAEEFGWRFAIARIDSDVPFSHYPETDRIFTLLEGEGLNLDFEGKSSLAVHERFVPHAYACDVPTFCRLVEGPCRALNLFLKRGAWTADVDILSSNAEISHQGTLLVHVLRGRATVDGEVLEAGDTAVTENGVFIRNDGGIVYAALLTKA
jgi:environmental stress-induced protein Ves